MDAAPWSVFPPALLERLNQVVPATELPAVLEALSHGRPTTFRANTIKTSATALFDELTTAGFELEQVPWYSEAFILRNKGLRDLTETPAYLEGRLYVQSLSSMIPPLIMDPQPGEAILDIAAAPGSKTTQLAMMMENRGQIIANDTSTVRLYKLRANLAMQGVDNVTTRQGLGQLLWQDFPDIFDRSLVDVPCSMEGRLNALKPKSWANWSPKKIKELALRQRSLLRAAISATKPGGVIIYSTCTLSPEENEGVLTWILKKEAGKVEIEPIGIAGVKTTPALTQWPPQVFPSELAGTMRILPSDTMEGFFVAKLRKVG